MNQFVEAGEKVENEFYIFFVSLCFSWSQRLLRKRENRVSREGSR